MHQQGDLFVLILVVGGLLLWLLRFLYYWLTKPHTAQLASPIPKQGEHVEMLVQQGFEWVSGKQKIPIRIDAGESSSDSRLFIDGLVVKDGKRYVVKLSRDQKPLRWSGAAVRDALMIFQLIYNADGVVYVDLQHHKIKAVSFQTDIPVTKRMQKNWWPYMIGMAFGAWLTYVMFH
jgi:hypothetical protein